MGLRNRRSCAIDTGGELEALADAAAVAVNAGVTGDRVGAVDTGVDVGALSAGDALVFDGDLGAGLVAALIGGGVADLAIGAISAAGAGVVRGAVAVLTGDAGVAGIALHTHRAAAVRSAHAGLDAVAVVAVATLEAVGAGFTRRRDAGAAVVTLHAGTALGVGGAGVAICAVAVREYAVLTPGAVAVAGTRGVGVFRYAGIAAIAHEALRAVPVHLAEASFFADAVAGAVATGRAVVVAVAGPARTYAVIGIAAVVVTPPTLTIFIAIGGDVTAAAFAEVQLTGS